MTRILYSPQSTGDEDRYKLFLKRAHAIMSDFLSKYMALNPRIEDDFVIEDGKHGGLVARRRDHNRVLVRARFKRLGSGTILIKFEKEA